MKIKTYRQEHTLCARVRLVCVPECLSDGSAGVLVGAAAASNTGTAAALRPCRFAKSTHTDVIIFLMLPRPNSRKSSPASELW